MTPRKRPPAAAVAVIAALVTGLAVWAFLRSAYFAIEEVRVEGSRHLSAEEVRALAGVPVGDNLILLPVDRVERAVEEHVWVHDADVRRDLPSAVIIAIIERRPAGWVTDPDGVVVVAGDGTVLERRPEPPPALPELGRTTKPLAEGERVSDVTDAMRVAARMPRPVLRQIRAVEPGTDGVTLSLRAGGTVLYGAAVDLTAKNTALGELLRWARGEGVAIHTIDVRVPSAPSIQPAGGGHVAPSPTPSGG